MAELCGKCGANMALVGRMHACRARPVVIANARNSAVNTPVPAVNTAVNIPAPAVNTAPEKASASTSSTSNADSYAKQRVDPDKRRAYMRTYMAKRRAPRPDRLNS